MIAVTYSRYSSDNQRQESITAQQRAMRAFAKQQSYQVTHEFVDEALTATNDNRPQFLEMIKQLSSGRIKADVLLVHKLDRFARNRYDSAFYKRELRKVGVRLESVLERFDDSPESVLLEALTEGLAEYYSKNLAREVQKGMRETALQGKHCGGRPPLGYALDAEKRYVVDPRGAEAVRLIFTRYAAGASYTMILEELAAGGYLTSVGTPFRKTSLHAILINEKYTGVYLFNRAQAKNYNGTRNNHASKPAAEIIRLEGALPALIDAEIWRKVKERMEKNAHGGGWSHAKVTYLLSGLCTCTLCGRGLIGSSQSYQTRVSKEHRGRWVYTCPGNRLPEGEKCALPRWEKGELEEIVCDAVREEFFTDRRIDALSRQASEYIAKRRREQSGEGKRLEKELGRIADRTRNIVETVATLGKSTPTALLDELRELEAAKADTEARLLHWNLSQQLSTTPDEVRRYLLDRRAAFLAGDADARKTLLKEFVTGVEVTPENATIHLVIEPTTVVRDGGGGPLLRLTTVRARARRGRGRSGGHSSSSSQVPSSGK